MAYESPLTIAEVVRDISANKYVLPSIQREFVWSTAQIERLFDSVMQDYPFGAFLFWELSREQNTLYDFYSFLQNYHERDARHNPKVKLTGNDNVMAVLDGQQRLTSIFIGLKGTYAYKKRFRQWKDASAFPERTLYLNIMGSADSEMYKYEFAFLAADEVKNDNAHYWFEVGNILNMTGLGDVMNFLVQNIFFSGLYKKEQTVFATDTLSQLFKVIHTQPGISYYKVRSGELDKVLQIFIRVNSGGTVLSYSDLLLSIATAQWEGLDARKEITEFVDYINTIGSGFNVNKDFILKAALVLTGFPNIAFKVDNFNKQNMLAIEKKWRTIKLSITQAFLLVSSFGFSRDSLKSNNAVIPIAYYLMTRGNPKNFEKASAFIDNRRKIKKWLTRSLIKRVFSGQPDNVLRLLRKIIRANDNKEFPLDEIINKLRGTSKTIVFTDDDIENLLELQYGRSDTLMVLMLLYPSLDYNNRFHIDHIYPKGKFTGSGLEKRGVPADRTGEYIKHVNDISNLQLLAAVPNIEKQDKDFADWFAANCPTDTDKIQYRKINYLPDMDYTYGNFISFIGDRRGLLRKQLKADLL